MTPDLKSAPGDEQASVTTFDLTPGGPLRGSSEGGRMLARVILLSLLAVLAVGCSARTTTPTQPMSRALQIVPADDATGVRLDAAVRLDFGVAVDRSAVEGGVHLISESDMSAGCPDSSMAAHGTMDAVMNDPSMLAHMNAFHATRGRFSWNAPGTVCTFQPDSLMRPQTRYMVHMSGAMLEMMSRMGGSMAGGQMNGSGDMMEHFRTTTAVDHAGHHP